VPSSFHGVSFIRCPSSYILSVSNNLAHVSLAISSRPTSVLLRDADVLLGRTEVKKSSLVVPHRSAQTRQGRQATPHPLPGGIGTAVCTIRSFPLWCRSEDYRSAPSLVFFRALVGLALLSPSRSRQILLILGQGRKERSGAVWSLDLPPRT